MPSGLLVVVRALPLSSPLQLLLVATGLTLDSVGPALVSAQYFAIVSIIAGHVLTGPTHDSGSTPGYVTNLYGSYPQRVTEGDSESAGPAFAYMTWGRRQMWGCTVADVGI